MKIGVVGSGNMGRSLGALFAELGHEVFFGARRQEQAQAAATLAKPQALFGSNTDAARFGDVVVWTVRGAAVTEVVSEVEVLAGKPVLDMSNLPASASARNQVHGSMAEQLQSAGGESLQQLCDRAVRTCSEAAATVRPQCVSRFKQRCCKGGRCGPGTRYRVCAD